MAWAAVAGGNFALVPVISAQWLSGQGYAVDDAGLAPNQTGSIRIHRTGYDQTFLAQKTLLASSVNAQYSVYLVNCLWGKELAATYDRTNKLCVVTFDPANLFADTNAPAWDGPGMKEGVPYFATLQAQAWLWHDAGANQGLAIDWGAGVVPSVFHPIQLSSPAFRLEPVEKNGAKFTFRAFGSIGVSCTLEFRRDLGPGGSWVTVTSLTPTASPFLLTDSNAVAPACLYRARQP